jgi:hypothetical protein
MLLLVRRGWPIALLLLTSCKSDRSREAPREKETAPLAPSAPREPVEQPRGLFTRSAVEGARVEDLAVSDSHVYWMEIGPPRSGHSKLMRRAKHDGAREEVADKPDGGFAVDRQFIYWVNRKEVWRRPHSGGSAERLFEGGGRLVAAQDGLYVVGPSQILRWRPGSAPEPLATGDEHFNLAAVTAASNALYSLYPATEREGAKVNGRLEAFEPARRVLVESVAAPGSVLESSGGALYYLDAGRLHRLPLTPNARPEPLLDSKWPLERFVVAGDGVYASALIAGWGIYRIPLAGGSADKLAELTGRRPRRLAVDAEHVYWDVEGDIYRAER